MEAQILRKPDLVSILSFFPAALQNCGTHPALLVGAFHKVRGAQTPALLLLFPTLQTKAVSEPRTGVCAYGGFQEQSCPHSCVLVCASACCSRVP